MIAGCYSMHLYCDAAKWDAPPHGFDEFPHEFTGETASECRSAARKRGWKIDIYEGKATCPKCAAQRRTPPAD